MMRSDNLSKKPRTSVIKSAYKGGHVTVLLTRYFRMSISCILLLFSVNSLALTCPGSQDFVNTDGKIWGWSWTLSPDRYKDFPASRDSWKYYSPSDRAFSPNTPLTVGLYLDSNSPLKGVLYCRYELTSGETIEVLTPNYKNLSQDEVTRIAGIWKSAQSPVLRGPCKQESHFDVPSSAKLALSGYECSTTAGAADKCNVNFM